MKENKDDDEDGDVLFSHSLVHFQCVRVAVNLEPVLGMLGVRWEYTLNGITVHQQAPCTLIYTKRRFLGGWRTGSKPRNIHANYYILIYN